MYHHVLIIGSNYKAGDALSLLKKLVEDVKKNPAHAEIPLDRNIFCFDNEAFRYLAAIKNGIEFGSEIKRWSTESWKRSSKECWEYVPLLLAKGSLNSVTYFQHVFLYFGSESSHGTQHYGHKRSSKNHIPVVPTHGGYCSIS